MDVCPEADQGANRLFPKRRGIRMTAPLQTQTDSIASSRVATSVQAPAAALAVPPSPCFLNIKRSYLEALEALGYTMNGKVYHVFSRRLYRQIGRENLRNHREHEFEYIQ